MWTAACLAVVASTPVLSAAPASGAERAAPTGVTILVPGQQPTIQAAINAASAGDTVVVSPGTYAGGITFAGKAITVRSAGGPSATTIVGHDGPVVRFDSGESAASVLQGFTITGGSVPSVNGFGAGVKVAGASPTIEGNVITGNDSCNGGGIEIDGGGPTIFENVVAHNVGDSCNPGSGAIWTSSNSAPAVALNVVENNDEGGIVGTAGVIFDNVVLNNQGDGIDAGGSSIVAQNLVVGNLIGIRAGGSAEVVNNTVAANVAAPLWLDSSATVDNNVFVGPLAVSPLQCNAAGLSVSAVSHNDFWSPYTPTAPGCPALPATSGNISADPHFVGLYQLAAGSPAIGTGTTSAPFVFTSDLLQKPRTVNGKIDMGAFEQQPAEPIATVPPPTVLHVPGEYPTIQQALDAATDGELVLVGPGTYAGNLDFHGKNIVLASSGGPKVTTLQAVGPAAGVVFAHGETRAAVLDGFTLTGSAIEVFKSSPSIVGNLIDVDSSGITLDFQSAPLIAGNVIAGTHAPTVDTPDGIAGESIGASIIGNVIADARDGINLTGASPVVIADNLVIDNLTGIGISYLGQSQILQNVVVANHDGIVVLSDVKGSAPQYFTANTVVANTDTGVGVPGGLDSFIFTDNVIQGRYPFSCDNFPGGHPVLTDNDIEAAPDTLVVNGCLSAVPAGNLSADPGFTPGSFVPGPGSPLINAGTLRGVISLPTDFAGKPRVAGGAVDIGAFERQP